MSKVKESDIDLNPEDIVSSKEIKEETVSEQEPDIFPKDSIFPKPVRARAKLELFDNETLKSRYPDGENSYTKKINNEKGEGVPYCILPSNKVKDGNSR